MRVKKDIEFTTSTGMCLGVMFGACIGTVMHNIGLWLPVGLCFGVCFGAAMEKKNMKKQKEKLLSDEIIIKSKETDLVVMELKKLEYDLTVCKLSDIEDVDINKEFFFIGRTDEEISLVCKTEDTPVNTIERDDGWRGFRIQGMLDFSLIGILSKLSGILAENKIGIFAVSTYNTDYILVKKENFDHAMDILCNAGYSLI